MSSEANRIVQKLWSYCTVLRDDGLSYGDYLEQLSVLLFLKLAHEQTQPPWNQDSPVPSPPCAIPTIQRQRCSRPTPKTPPQAPTEVFCCYRAKRIH